MATVNLEKALATLEKTGLRVSAAARKVTRDLNEADKRLWDGYRSTYRSDRRLVITKLSSANKVAALEQQAQATVA